MLDDAAGGWAPVPAEPEVLVLNCGSLLAALTGNRVRATRHRVPGPASADSLTAPEVLRADAGRARVSIAFFVDPDEGCKAGLEADAAGAAPRADLSVAEYIAWRAGDGDGVAFIPGERTPQ